MCANSQTKHGPWHLLFTAPCDGLFLHRGALFGPVGAPPACGAASCSKTPSSPVFARSTTTALLLSAPTAKTCCLMASPFHCPGVRSGPNVRLVSGESLALTRSPEEAKRRLFFATVSPQKVFLCFFFIALLRGVVSDPGPKKNLLTKPARAHALTPPAQKWVCVV